MLSLVNAATVAFDLVRSPGGADAAEVLLAALDAGPDELSALEQVARRVDPDLLAADRTAARSILLQGGPVPLAEALADLATEFSEADANGPSPVAVRAVATMPLCRGTDLATLLTDDVLGWTRTSTDAGSDRLWPHATDALLDALTAALAASTLTADQRSRLLAPLRQAGLLAEPGDLGPNEPAVTSVLALAAELTPEQAAAIARVHTGEPGWTLAMHRACWAVYLSGRLRPAAAAQFALARTLGSRPDRLRLAAEGALSALSGAVHAEMVADLLDDRSRTRLLAPLQS